MASDYLCSFFFNLLCALYRIVLISTTVAVNRNVYFFRIKDVLIITDMIRANKTRCNYILFNNL